MITQKLKICSCCGDPCKLWKSHPALCRNCWGKEKAAEQRAQPLTQTSDGKTAKPFKVGYRTKSLTADQKEDKIKMDTFFKAQAELVPLRCENCNGLLNAFNTWAKKCVTAHILPKAIFESVATHPDNRMFLGKGFFSECNCHDLWDWRNADDRKEMRCYEMAVNRAMLFYDELTPHEQNMADKYLGLELSKAI